VFDGFELTRCEGDDGVRLRVRHGGSGPAVLLLHGHPRTHATWHRVAPLLAAAGHTVVCPDLRGYGRSDKPATDPEHRPYSKRAMAGDCLAIMRRLGHERFTVVGHDRGAYVATRLALDHPGAVSAVSVLDAVPIGEALRRCDAGFAASWWHWFFLGQTDKPAERVINADPDAWYSTPAPDVIGAGNHADVWAAMRDPAVVHGMCEDYRAGLAVDWQHDEADRAAGRRVDCPTLLLESARDDLDIHGDPARIWASWLRQPLSHRVVDSGHHQAEEAPGEVAEALLTFLDRS
jgi:haloacetate dehalogenase